MDQRLKLDLFTWAQCRGTHFQESSFGALGDLGHVWGGEVGLVRRKRDAPGQRILTFFLTFSSYHLHNLPKSLVKLSRLIITVSKRLKK